MGNSEEVEIRYNPSGGAPYRPLERSRLVGSQQHLTKPRSMQPINRPGGQTFRREWSKRMPEAKVFSPGAL